MGICAATDQKEDNKIPGRPAGWLPAAFSDMVYIVAPPSYSEPGQICLQQEMRAGRKGANKESPPKKARAAPFGMFPWKIFRAHIPVAQSISLLPLAAKFNTATDYIQAIGVSDWAQHGSDGQAADEVHFPFSMRFHPTGEFEFSQEWSGTYFLDQLETIPEGSTLWEVYGMSAPEELGGQEYFIGNLETTSALTSSNWGDNGLFFRHQWAEDDCAAMPEW